jgi:phosphatidylserine/phosphatidylglycerophosphate/cardiolipin synthase-like enzyme
LQVILLLGIITQTGNGGAIRVWFAQDSLGLRLVEFINGAVSSIDYCCYNSSRDDVIPALINAYQRGVRVRVITDDSRLNDVWVARLRAAGIAVWSDSGFSGSDYMHNKFVVRDLADEDSTNDRLWTGSYNPNQDELNADFALEIDHSGLARAYRAEFNQMWGSAAGMPVPDSARFHSRKRDMLVTHRFLINGFPVEVYFAPQDRLVDSITAQASRARQEILFTIFSFTYQSLGQALIERWGEGVRVAGVIDKSGANSPFSQYPVLREQNIPVLIDSVPFGTGVLHEKLMVIDYRTVIAGSANWSNNANFNNDENILLIFNPELAKRFYPEIICRYGEAGGVYPPGIEELPAQMVFSSPTRFSRSFRSEPGAMVFDAAGRMVNSGMLNGPGVYFVSENPGKTYRLVLIR